MGNGSGRQPSRKVMDKTLSSWVSSGVVSKGQGKAIVALIDKPNAQTLRAFRKALEGTDFGSGYAEGFEESGAQGQSTAGDVGAALFCVIGAWYGSTVAPGAGTAVGAFIGAQVGKAVGEVINDAVQG